MQFYRDLIVYFVFISVCRWDVVNSTALFGSCLRPSNFPAEITLRTRSYQNFDGQVQMPFAYVVEAKNAFEVVTLAHWAVRNGYRIRASGANHNWSPLIFDFSTNGVRCPKTILVDTTKHLTSMTLNPHDPGRPDLNSVTVGPGVTLGSLLEFLGERGLGLFACPSIPSITIGGILAVGAHGAGIPSKSDKKSVGHSYGTVSNLVVELTIVAWDNSTESYRLKTLHRSNKDCKAVLTSLGRTFITSVTLRVGKDQNLRTQQYFFVPNEEFFAHPENLNSQSRAMTLASFMDSHGRMESVGFASSSYTWVTAWRAEDTKPPESQMNSGSTSNPLMDLLTYISQSTEPASRFLSQIVPELPVKLIGTFAHSLLYAGTYLSGSLDLWGPSKNNLLYFPSSPLRTTNNGITILTSRQNLQLVVSLIEKYHSELVQEFAKNNQYPNLVELSFRIGGADDPEDIQIPGAESPGFSAASVSNEFPEYNIVVWMQGAGFPETRGMNDFYTKLQTKLLENLHRKFGILRAEWSKVWAYSKTGPWQNKTVLRQILPRSLSSSDKLEEWNFAIRTLNLYDPFKIFSNPFLDEFLVMYE